MNKPKLFQIALVLHPTKEEAEKGVKSSIILQPKTIIAMDEKQAAIIAGREIPEELLSKLDQVDIAVRPF